MQTLPARYNTGMVICRIPRNVPRRAFVLLACFLALAVAGRPTLAQPSGLVRLTHDGDFKQRPCWSADGQHLIYARHEEEQLRQYFLDVASGESKRLTDVELPNYDGVWSPDGQLLAYSHANASGSQGNVDVYLANADGSEVRPFAVGEGALSHEEWPSWSPDGAQVAFTSTAPGNQEVMLLARDGTGLVQLTNHVGTDAHPAWSPDGRYLAFATDRFGGLELARIEIDTGEIVRLTESPGLDDYPTYSPDGEWLAFVSQRDGNREIYVQPAAGGSAFNVSQSPSLEMFPAWTPDSAALTYVSDRDGGFDLYTQPFVAPAESANQ